MLPESVFSDDRTGLNKLIGYQSCCVT